MGENILKVQVYSCLFLNHINTTQTTPLFTNIDKPSDMRGPKDFVKAAHEGAARPVEVILLGQEHQLVAFAVDTEIKFISLELAL